MGHWYPGPHLDEWLECNSTWEWKTTSLYPTSGRAAERQTRYLRLRTQGVLTLRVRPGQNGPPYILFPRRLPYFTLVLALYPSNPEELIPPPTPTPCNFTFLG